MATFLYYDDDMDIFNALMLELLKATNMNRMNSEQDTLLILAIYHKNQAMIDWILDHNHTYKIDVNAKNTKGETALDWAIKTQNISLIKRLITCGGSTGKWTGINLVRNICFLSTPMRLLSHNDLETFNLLMPELLKTINIHCVNAEQDTLLILAIYYRNQAMIDWILNHNDTLKININAQNMNGETALYLAIEKKDFSLIKQLVTLGAELLIYDDRKLVIRILEILNNELKLLGNLRLKNQFIDNFLKNNEPTCKSLISNDAELNKIEPAFSELKLLLKKAIITGNHREIQSLVEKYQAIILLCTYSKRNAEHCTRNHGDKINLDLLTMADLLILYYVETNNNYLNNVENKDILLEKRLFSIAYVTGQFDFYSAARHFCTLSGYMGYCSEKWLIC